MLYKGEELSDNEHDWGQGGGPLDFRPPVLISPTGAPKPHITLTVGNKLIGFLIYATLLCKLNTQIIFSPEQLDIGSHWGLFDLVQSGELQLPSGGLHREKGNCL